MQISRRGRVWIEAVPFSRDHSSVYALFIMSELFEKNNDGRRIEGFGTKKKNFESRSREAFMVQRRLSKL